MNSLQGSSQKILESEITKLAELFPSTVTEGKVDFEALKALLGEDVDLNERYSLGWKGKSGVFRAIQEPTTKTLRPVRNESVDFDTTENIFIEGDNLEVLKALQRSYFGKIKMIYIDPPYNTGNDFVYNDTYAQNRAEYEVEAGIRDQNGNVLETGGLRKNSRDDGHYHSNWLNMMYPRLYLARNLLREDGFIFVSIDDHELHNLRSIMTEVFGEDNFVGIVTRNTGTPTGGGNDILVNIVDYLVIFAKSEEAGLQGLDFTEQDAKIYDLEDENGKYLIRSLRRTGGEDRRIDRPSMYYPLNAPDGSEVYPLGPTGYESRWICGKSKYEKLFKEGLIEWRQVSEKGSRVWKPYQRFYLEGRKKLASNLWGDLEGNKKASRDLKALFGGKVFETPKPVELILKCIEIASDSDSLILDFFAGSGTLAEAVMRANLKDSGSRKWICVQLSEEVQVNSEAAKMGFATIADIAKERIRRVSKKLSNNNQVDLGFKVLKLDQTNFNLWNTNVKNTDQLRQQMLNIFNSVREDAGEEDLLTELILKNGIELTAKREQKDSGRGNYWLFDGGLVICLAQEMSAELFGDLLAEKPETLIILESSLRGNDQLKVNLTLQAEREGVKAFVV